jgi:5-methylcytosine-specific restriction protein A
MPYQPLRRCTEPGCNVRVKSGKCDQHKREARRQSDSRRGTRTERGYSNRWGEYRRHFLSANPLCAHCLKDGVYTPATIVDHIIPIEGESDVLFWPVWNHQGLCQTHHNRKTTQSDPITKANRKAGMYQEQEARAAQRNDWMYEVGHD